MTELYAATVPMKLQPGDVRTEIHEGVETPMLTADMHAILLVFHVYLGSVIQACDAHGYTTLRLYGTKNGLETFIAMYDYDALGKQLPIEKLF